jgi:hypothetical protein
LINYIKTKKLIQGMDYTFVLLEYKEIDLSIGEKKMLTWIHLNGARTLKLSLVCFRVKYNGGRLQRR